MGRQERTPGNRCSFCGRDQGPAVVMARADDPRGVARICHACVHSSLAALKAAGRPIHVDCMELHCSFCGRHQAASRPVQPGRSAQVCIYCLEQARNRLEVRSRQEADSSDQRRAWHEVLRAMSRLVEQGRAAEYAARLGFAGTRSSGEVTAEVAHAVRRLRGWTGLDREEFASVVRRETGKGEPTADQLAAWEAGWECLPMDLLLELACVATAHSRAGT